MEKETQEWVISRMISLGWLPERDVSDVNWSFDAALAQYQVWAGLPVTGTVDYATVKSLQAPRFCGLPDHIITEQIRRNPIATWRFAGPALPTVGLQETLVEIQKSFDKWSAVAPIQATQAAENDTPSILITTLRLDGRNGVLADCQLPGPRVQQMRLDSSELYIVALPGDIPGGRIGLGNVLTHELGHFWGFGHHSGDTNSLMDAIYDPDIDKPQTRDVREMQRLYPGSPAKPPVPDPLPPPPTGNKVVIEILNPTPGQINVYLNGKKQKVGAVT